MLAVARDQNLLLEYWGGRKDLGAQQRIGAALGKRRDRVFGGYRIRPASTGATGGNAYRLEKIEVRNKTPKTPETPSTLTEEVGLGEELNASPSRNSAENSGNQGNFFEPPGRNSPLPADIKSGVSGVSGVLVGDGSEDGPDVMEVD